jgi:hypothetical protein
MQTRITTSNNDITKGGRRKIYISDEKPYDKEKFRRFNPPIEINKAWDLFNDTAKKQIKDFRLDENNELAFLQMFYWFYGDSKNFNGDLKKGLFLVGNVGSGKTEAFNIFKKWVELSHFDHAPHAINFNIGHSKRIKAEFEDETDGGITSLKKYLSNGAWVFNDLGKEIKEGLASHYGTKMNIFEYILDDRYILFKDFGIPTHITSNFPLEGKSGKRYFKEMYGEYIDDRMKEMFNTIVFRGNSRRK